MESLQNDQSFLSESISLITKDQDEKDCLVSEESYQNMLK